MFNISKLDMKVLGDIVFYVLFLISLPQSCICVCSSIVILLLPCACFFFLLCIHYLDHAKVTRATVSAWLIGYFILYRLACGTLKQALI